MAGCPEGYTGTIKKTPNSYSLCKNACHACDQICEWVNSLFLSIYFSHFVFLHSFWYICSTVFVYTNQLRDRVVICHHISASIFGEIINRVTSNSELSITKPWTLSINVPLLGESTCSWLIPTQRANNAENVSMPWHHLGTCDNWIQISPDSGIGHILWALHRFEWS